MTLEIARRVLVTGGTSNLGRAIVKRLTEEGSRVVFTGRNSVIGNALSKETGATFLLGDTCIDGEVEAIVQRTRITLGGLDGLVLNAGVLHNARISETTDDAWDNVINTNLVSPFLFARFCMAMLAECGGSIVTIASGTALWTEMELGAYSVSKRALLWLTQMLAVEGATRGVNVNAICPGDTESGMAAYVGEEPSPYLHSPALPPLGRHAVPDDIASAVIFFLGSESAFCTGASLVVDGGMRAALRANKVRA